MVNTEIFRDNFVTGTMTGNMADHRKRVLDINYTLTEDAMISIYLRPIGVHTATRYLQSTYTYKIKY